MEKIATVVMFTFQSTDIVIASSCRTFLRTGQKLVGGEERRFSNEQ